MLISMWGLTDFTLEIFVQPLSHSSEPLDEPMKKDVSHCRSKPHGWVRKPPITSGV